MKFSVTCQSCNRLISLTYDEGDATPLFCPYCGEPIEDDSGEYDKVNDSLDAWDDDDR
jgi:DNA-directed RNA polymerase subunit N (RpoN/RPB10)